MSGKAVILLLASAAILSGWGREGHHMIGRIAVRTLPSDMPAFFRKSISQLELLNPEPDVWRDRSEQKLSTALFAATDGDHHFKIEMYPLDSLPKDRWAYLETLQKRGQTALDVGILPYRSMELFQTIRVDFRAWRASKGKERRMIEARIINDAGILGHYIADASNPLHMSVNYNGWAETDNPNGYTRDQSLHRRFESEFVKYRIKESDVLLLVEKPAVARDPFRFIQQHMMRSFGQLDKLYQLEKSETFGEKNTNAEARRFAAVQLASGASALRDLWYTAWVTSGL